MIIPYLQAQCSQVQTLKINCCVRHQQAATSKSLLEAQKVPQARVLTVSILVKPDASGLRCLLLGSFLVRLVRVVRHACLSSFIPLEGQHACIAGQVLASSGGLQVAWRAHIALGALGVGQSVIGARLAGTVALHVELTLSTQLAAAGSCLLVCGNTLGASWAAGRHWKQKIVENRQANGTHKAAAL